MENSQDKNKNKCTSYCCTCKWYEIFDGVCMNDKSRNCANFTSVDDVCEAWEEEKPQDLYICGRER